MITHQIVLRFRLGTSTHDQIRARFAELLEKVAGVSRVGFAADELILLVDAVADLQRSEEIGRIEHQVTEILHRRGVDASLSSAMMLPGMDADDAIRWAMVGSDLRLFLDPGNAPPAVVARVLEALSNLHRAAGGTGLAFRTDGELAIRVAAGVP